MYEHIAIALDGSAAALTAAAFTRHLDATDYHILHVIVSGTDEAPSSDSDRRREQQDRLAAQTPERRDPGDGVALARSAHLRRDPDR